MFISEYSVFSTLRRIAWLNQRATKGLLKGYLVIVFIAFL